MAIKYLSGKRLQGTAAERTALNLGSPPQTSWKELARASLSGAGDTITTSTFTAKDNIKVLVFGLASGNIEAALQVGNGSIDTGSNYAVRWQVNGTNGTGQSKPAIDTNHTASGNEFIEYDIVNIAGQEKLVIAKLVDSASAGANAPNRVEHVGKWSNTSNQINIVQAKNVGGGSFDTGSEIVVLGYDNDEADSGTNFWQELASVELSSAGDTITSGVFTAKKYLMIQCNMIATGAASMELTFNNDTGSNYARRRSQNGGTDNTSTSRANIDIGFGDTTDETAFFDMYIINKSDKEKLLISELNATSSGAGNAPHRREIVGKWTNTSNQITRVDITNPDSGSFNTGTILKVWGAD